MDRISHLPTVVGIFERREQAEVAVDALWHAGFGHDQVGLAAPGQRETPARTAIGEVESSAAKGAVVGAVTGGTLGAVAGALATGLIPGIGPVVAGGLLAGIVTGAAAGAAGGGYIGPFIALGFTQDQAQRYGSKLQAGRTIVVVHNADRSEKAVEILQNTGALEVITEAPELAAHH